MFEHDFVQKLRQAGAEHIVTMSIEIWATPFRQHNLQSTRRRQTKPSEFPKNWQTKARAITTIFNELNTHT
jgi:hypothetical protein